MSGDKRKRTQEQELEQHKEIKIADNTVYEVEIPIRATFIHNAIRNKELLQKTQLMQSPSRKKELNMNDFLSLNGHHLYDLMKLQNPAQRSFRKNIEKIQASKQCKNTIGECNKSKDLCWICQKTIECDEKVHCEHVIPVIFATMFLGIYGSKINYDLKRAFELNYDYAHDKCNMSKSSLLLIKWDDEMNRMVFNTETANELFERILRTGRIANDEKPRFINNLLAKINPICNYINDEYSAFLEMNMSITDFIKYLLGTTQLYLSEENQNNAATPQQIRESLANTIINHIKKEKKFIKFKKAGEIYDFNNKSRHFLTRLREGATRFSRRNYPAPVSEDKEKITDEELDDIKIRLFNDNEHMPRNRFTGNVNTDNLQTPNIIRYASNNVAETPYHNASLLADIQKAGKTKKRRKNLKKSRRKQ